MNISDILVLSWKQLRQRRLRTLLTMLAVAVGVTSIIALSAQVSGVSESISNNLSKLGPDTIIVTVRGSQPFSDADVFAMETLEGVSRVIPTTQMRVNISGVNDITVNIIGIRALDFVDLLTNFKIVDGGMYFDAPSPQALIGENVAVDSSSGLVRYSSGQPILARSGTRSITLTVVGVLGTYGGATLIQPDNSVFVPLDYLKQLVRGSGYSTVFVKADSTEDVDSVTQLIGQAFSGRVNVISINQITNTVVQITGQVGLLLVAVAGTSFIAAGLGTLNIMMISVLERVREIGIFKSLGMKDREVLSIYLVQGILVGSLGIVVGMGLGVGVAFLLPAAIEMLGTGAGRGGGAFASAGASVGFSMSYTPIISLQYVAIASATSIIVTVLSTAYPARRASKLKPVDALKYE